MKIAELRRELEARGLAPRHSLGQNFLVDPSLLATIPEDAQVAAGEPVLEIGPGPGGLTEHLLKRGARVLAVEIDRGLAQWLRERFAAALALPADADGSLRLVEGDALDRNERFHPEVESWWEAVEQPRIVANLPYAISGPFLARLPGRQLLGAYLLLQAEVVDKAAAASGEREVGPLSIRLHESFAVSKGRKVPAEVFWPRPRIASAFLQLKPRVDGPTPDAAERLRKLLKVAFAQRRKRVLPRIAEHWPEAAEALRAQGVAEEARAEAVAADAWRHAAERLILRDGA